MKKRQAHLSLLFLKIINSACLDQGHCNLKMPTKAHDSEASACLLTSHAKKHLAPQLDQSLCSLNMPFLAREKEARAAVLITLEMRLHPVCLDENLCNSKMLVSTGQEQTS
jgi:hypothetical protein